MCIKPSQPQAWNIEYVDVGATRGPVDVWSPGVFRSIHIRQIVAHTAHAQVCPGSVYISKPTLCIRTVTRATSYICMYTTLNPSACMCVLMLEVFCIPNLEIVSWALEDGSMPTSET